MDNLIANIKAIKDCISLHNYTVIRFMFTDSLGDLQSITVPVSKFITANDITILKLLGIPHYATLDLFLLPDFSTAFSDPCSIHLTLCILCSIHNSHNFIAYDDRANLDTAYVIINAVSGFMIDDVRNNTNQSNQSIDSLHDIRTEIALELYKAGIDVNVHYILPNNVCKINFNSNSFASLGDNIQKLKMLTQNIVGSYSKFMHLKEITFTMKLAIKSCTTDEFNIEKINDYSMITFYALNSNPYTLIRKILL